MSRRRLFRLASRRPTSVEDLDEELRLHLDLRVAELVSEGWEPEAARAEALRRFGDLERHRRAAQGIDRGKDGEARRRDWWDGFRQDLQFALRAFGRQPGFTAVAVLTLAFGIGATTAILSIVNGVLLRPLPYPNGDRVVQIWQSGIQGSGAEGAMLPASAANFVDLREQSTTLERLAAFRNWDYTLSEDGETALLAGARVSAGFFEALGVEPARGRTFSAADELVGAEAVALIGDGLWRRRFGADPAMIGRTITLNRTSFRVVGVMPRGFQFPRGAELPAGLRFAARTEIWTPLVITPGELEFRGTLNLALIGLPKPGVTDGAVAGDLETVMSRIRESYPRAAANTTARHGSLGDLAVAAVRPALLVLLGAVGFLLLIACVNVSNLLLTRTAARYRELAVRSALGAGRRRLLRLFVTENLLLALAGGALGVVVAIAGKNALLA
ncbi:MAG: ABC transporter permease, partial [Gemmatimonadales bacterium]